MGGKGGKGSHRTCEVCGIKERQSSESLLFSQFPLDESRCKAWLRAVGNEELVQLPIEKLHQLRHVCGNHFRRKDFNKKGNRLKKRAIPMLNLNASPLTDAQLLDFPQRMWRNRNEENLGKGASSSKQVEQSVAELSTTKSPKRQRDPDNNEPENSGKKIKLQDTLEPSGTQPLKRQLPADNKESEKPKKKIKFEETSGPSQDMPSTGASTSKQTEQSSSGGPSQDKPSTGASTSKQTEQSSIGDYTPRKKKLLAQLRKTKCTLKSLRKSAKLIENIDSPVLKEIVLNASKNQHRRPKGRRWTTQNKISALAIFKRSPKTYRYLNKIMPLPSEKTLQNILRKIPMKPGINKTVLSHLKNISEKRDTKNNLCCLLFDEMALKPRLIHNVSSDIVEGFEDYGEEFGRTSELADHALVFMIQGLREKFKQPIAFYFVKGTISSQKLAKIIKDIIVQVSATGFRVLNTVCDQGPTNTGALKLLSESTGPTDDGSNHYFQVMDQKIYIVYDVPHLFKSIRNNFQKNGTILFKGKKAQWCHLRSVEEKNRNFLYFSKITQVHVDPKYRAKMKVKYAAQILSNTVAAVLKLMSDAERDPVKSGNLMESAIVIQELDQLFDLTNGPSCPEDVKKGRRENVSLKTDHMDKWAESIKNLSTLKFLNKNGIAAKNVKCISGYITTLKSLRDIWLTVSELGHKYFNLRQVNQDALENLFGVIRQSSPTNRNPTCAHFMAALKTAVITKLSAHHSRGSNCEDDKKMLLTDFHNLVFESHETRETEKSFHEEDKTEEEKNEDGKNLEEKDEDYPVFGIPEDDDLILDDLCNIENQSVVYVSGYLASRIVKKSKCEICNENIRIRSPDDSGMYSYIELREWWEDKRSLTYPTANLCRLVQNATTATTQLGPRLHEPNICQLAMTFYSVECDANWFTCTMHKVPIFDLMFKILSLLFIRRQCQIINQRLALQEERTADAQKIAQQAGTAK